MVRTIGGKIALLTGAMILLFLVAFGAIIYFSLRAQLHRAVDDSLQLSMEQILSSVELEDVDQLSFEQSDIMALSLDDSDGFFRLVSPTGGLLNQRGRELAPISAQTLTNAASFFTVQASERDRPGNPGSSGDQEVGRQAIPIRLLSLPIMHNGQIMAYAQAGQSLAAVGETLRGLLTLYLLAIPFLVAISALGGYWLARQALAPIEHIRSEAAAISAADLTRRLNLDLPDDEVGRLARTFDQMLDRLEEGFQRQRRFAADASHELRTPLAVIQGEVDITLERQREPAEYVNALVSIGAETERVARLASDLLLLTRSDSEKLSYQRERLDLADLLVVLLEQMRAQAEAMGVLLEADLPAPLFVEGDRDRLLQLFINLLDNAITYAPGSRVQVLGARTEATVSVAITDAGPGIEPQHLPYLFERFYRSDMARGRERGGAGLGLAIAQEITRSHGGTIQVSSMPGKGSTFTVGLPHADHAGPSTPSRNRSRLAASR